METIFTPLRIERAQSNLALSPNNPPKNGEFNISCTELLNIFDKIGGKMKVDYYTEEATLYPQNISCNIKPNNSKQLDKLVDKSYLMYDNDEDGFYFLPLKDWKEDKLKKIHDEQLSVVGGFVIQFRKGKEGYNYPIKNFKKFVDENCDK